MTKIKKIIITQPKTENSFDLGEMLFVDENGDVTKWNEKTRKVENVGKEKKKA